MVTFPAVRKRFNDSLIVILRAAVAAQDNFNKKKAAVEIARKAYEEAQRSADLDYETPEQIEYVSRTNSNYARGLRDKRLRR